MLVEQLGTNILVYYWFLQRGRYLTSEYPHKFYMGYEVLCVAAPLAPSSRLITPT
jgi:hypothetical protein